jgi:hypothetical protein
MPWPSNLQDILGGVDISILNVATDWTAMRTHRQRLLENLATPKAGLRGVVGIHSDNLMTSSYSLVFKDSEKCAPGGVHNALGEMMVLDHPFNVEVLNGDMLIGLSVALRDLVVEITPLPRDLEMGLCRTPARFPASVRALLATGECALLASERGLTLAKVAWIRNGAAFAVGEEGGETNVNTDVRMRTCGWAMFCLWSSFTDKEHIPVSVSTQHEVSRLGSAFYPTMELDFDRATHLLGNGKMLAIGGKLKVRFMLSELDTMPAIGFLETRKADIRHTQLFRSKITFESLTESIREHLDGRGRHVFPTTCKLLVQIILRGECPVLLIVRLERCEHLIVEMPRLTQTSQEQVLLLLIRIEAILKRSHSRNLTRTPYTCQVAEVGTQPPMPQSRNMPSIPRAKAQGYTARCDKNV